jgi:hypothetical protein
VPVFVYPLAFIGLASLPALLAIYLLRNRYRRQPVSSLLLWLDPREVRSGGPRIDRLQTPLLFFIELALLILLVLAAAGPYLPASTAARPLVVVLDDSFSMLAGGRDSPRAAALEALEKELCRTGRPSIRFILAGERPTFLGEPVRSASAALRQLENWHCRALTANLQQALALAAEAGGALSALLVLTDQPPERELEKGRVQWWAFGQPRNNVAIVNASRNHIDGVERLLIEVANLSLEPRSTTLVVTAGDDETVLQRSQLELNPDQVHRLVLQLREGVPAVRARIDSDELTIDDAVTLMPAPARRVRVRAAVGDPKLRQHVEKALLATRQVSLEIDRPALIITDEVSPPDPPAGAWTLHVQGGKEEIAFDGPFILDHAHPLAEGLSLHGVIWGPGVKGPLPGAPVILAGNVPLVSDSEDVHGRHLIRMRLRQDLSTLTESLDWPRMITNLVLWRAGELPGLDRANVRLGDDVTLRLSSTPDDLRLMAPDGSSRKQPAQERRAVVRAEQVGLYTIRNGEEKILFACNALQRAESDLRGCRSGQWGEWLDDTALRLDYHEVGWVVLLVILALGTLHLFLASRSGGKP